MNYPFKTAAIYKQHKLTQWLDGSYVSQMVDRLRHALADKNVTCCYARALKPAFARYILQLKGDYA